MCINGYAIEREDCFCYLLLLKYNNTFQLAVKNNVAEAEVLFKIISEAADHILSVVSKLHLIDSLIIPIFIY